MSTDFEYWISCKIIGVNYYFNNNNYPLPYKHSAHGVIIAALVVFNDSLPY